MKDSIYNYCKPGTVFFKSFPECEPGTNFQEIIRRAEQIAQDTFFEVVEVGTIKDVLYRTRVSKIFEYADMEVVYATQPLFFSHSGHTNDTATAFAAQTLSCAKRRLPFLKNVCGRPMIYMLRRCA